VQKYDYKRTKNRSFLLFLSIPYNYFFSSKISLPTTIIINETYLSIRGKTYYLYTAIDDQTRQLLSFYLSDKRNGNAAFNLLQLLVARASNKTAKCLIITDGVPFYIPAICFANIILGTNFSHQIIIGLKSKHPLRPLKNKIERFYSTFNDSFKSHHRFKSFYTAF
jgi:transposase-like protein